MEEEEEDDEVSGRGVETLMVFRGCGALGK